MEIPNINRRIFSGRTYPNGRTKSRLLEVFLGPRYFNIEASSSSKNFTAEPGYNFDLEIYKIEEQQGKENCHWYRDSDGRLIVLGINLADEKLRIEITPNGFSLVKQAVRIFISYAKEDGREAARLYSYLRNRRYDVWFDSESLLPGERWRQRVESAMGGSDFCIALLSSRSVAKDGFVQSELRLAIDIARNKPPSRVFLIPARLDECEPEHGELKKLHWVDLFPDWNEGMSRIERTLALKGPVVELSG